ncbi:hypothetical protein QBG86_003875 [Salmonella enterica]|nr:hypothetical protein [Salmonella enterica]EKS2298069.1 hypothetical protein [Salmonella enterica]EKS2420443.1 hypothetical protein [Salmonella enterica]
MRQKLEDQIVYLSSLYFDNSNPMENRKFYYGDVVSDMFVASVISNMDDAAASQVIKDMGKLVDITSTSTRTGLVEYISYVKHRLHGINMLSETLRASREQNDQ